jgi:hypothetical protein
MIKNSELRLIDKLNIALDKPIELAVCAVKKNAVRCKMIPSQEPITFKKVRFEVEGEIITVVPSKVWQFNNTVYLSGKTISSRFDVGALGLDPLKLYEQGIFDPDEESHIIDDDDPFAKYYLPIMAYGPRRVFEMEQVIPFQDSGNWADDPITEASDAHENGDAQTAYTIINKVLSEDLRCIDAHAHLGNWSFNLFDKPQKFTEEKARKHYEAGLRIAELSFTKEFHDLLPWSHINNRPYLRCLHGFGLSLWRGGDPKAAKEVFEKMLWLNPYDNQGARILLLDIDAGMDWYQVAEEK